MFNKHYNGPWIGDVVYATLSGSNGYSNYPMKVVYLTASKINLMGTVNLGSGSWSTQCAKSWTVKVAINGKNYTVTAAIPTKKQISEECAEIGTFDFRMWTSTPSSYTNNYGAAYAYELYESSIGLGLTESVRSLSRGAVPFAEITL